MANTKQAEKRARKGAKRSTKIKLAEARSSVKSFLLLLHKMMPQADQKAQSQNSKGDSSTVNQTNQSPQEKKQILLQKYYATCSTVDRLAGKGAMHRNKAARIKSRLNLLLKRTVLE